MLPGDKEYYFEGPFKVTRGDRDPLVDLSECSFCRICGAVLFEEKQEQHVFFHKKLIAILNDIKNYLPTHPHDYDIEKSLTEFITGIPYGN